MPRPKNWPSTLPYLTAPLHGKDLTPAHLAAIRTKPSSSSASSTADVPVISAADTPPLPCPRVKIQPITSPASHPALGQCGLFAARNLAPGTLILAYLGRVHAGGGGSAAGAAGKSSSDYDLWLDREADVAVDAAACGNEARFVNDYRGVGPARPNAEFRPAFCERWGEVCVGVWVMAAAAGGKGKGQGGKGGIRKGEEILVSYGKGFWEERRREMEEGEEEEAEEEEEGGSERKGA
ncbi:SET domain-containing protein [Beauveria bassiana ARSEF 2860]|uniref:SET domain-containing protein n=1 Tax=Beauveria bassiana (strain ARSEF 2860) TaxID=655819 RepID=J4WD20_BEAB2|nr:SET domain-containing protein [Beauveria bassiana ARSEF 2860]EJP67945.1 SET domain-containing protein [Beauveria bassiana ARSEF 2860]